MLLNLQILKNLSPRTRRWSTVILIGTDCFTLMMMTLKFYPYPRDVGQCLILFLKSGQYFSSFTTVFIIYSWVKLQDCSWIQGFEAAFLSIESQLQNAKADNSFPDIFSVYLKTIDHLN